MIKAPMQTRMARIFMTGRRPYLSDSGLKMNGPMIPPKFAAVEKNVYLRETVV